INDRCQCLLKNVCSHKYVEENMQIKRRRKELLAFTTSSNKSVPFVLPCILLTPIISTVILISFARGGGRKRAYAGHIKSLLTFTLCYRVMDFR
ncbi:hypothetical protein L9F63_024978, partial [Diploptera punctata]